MDSFLIKGGAVARGSNHQRRKNAVLPIMAATLLTAEPCVIRRVPNLSDVRFMGQILTWLGAQVRFEGDTVRIHAKKIKGSGDYDLIRKMRGSICVMGPLLGRLKKAAGLAAGRLRDWRPAHQSAPEGIRGAGREGRDRERLCAGRGQAPGWARRCSWAGGPARRCSARPT